MISPLGLVVLAALDACSPGEPLPRDAAAAEVYLEVAEEELARGDPAAARAAYARAVRLDPRSARAQAGFRATCAQVSGSEDALAPALEAMRAGDCRAAISLLSRARQVREDPEAALLEGICRYELDQRPQARLALEVARAEPSLTDTAALYLSLLALREDDGAEAARQLAPVLESGDPANRRAAEALRRVARGTGRLVIALAVEGGHDTNPYLAPLAAAQTGVADQLGLLLAQVRLQPFGASGPFARLHGTYRDLRLSHEYDSAQAVAAAGYRLGTGATFASAEYGFEASWLGARPYATTHRVAAAGGWGRGPWSVSARYGLRLEGISAPAFAAYSGVQQDAALAVERWFDSTGVSLSWLLLRADAAEDVLSFTEHGPRAQVRLWSGGPRTLSLHAAWLFRPFDRRDPALRVRRDDQLLEGGARFEAELTAGLRAHAEVLGTWAQSNAEDFRYGRLSLGAGLSWVAAPW